MARQLAEAEGQGPFSAVYSQDGQMVTVDRSGLLQHIGTPDGAKKFLENKIRALSLGRNTHRLIGTLGLLAGGTIATEGISNGGGADVLAGVAVAAISVFVAITKNEHYSNEIGFVEAGLEDLSH